MTTAWGWHYRRERESVCQRCGDVIETLAHNTRWCEPCRAEVQRERAEARREAHAQRQRYAAHHHWERLPWEVVHDPQGDFRPGARFGWMDIRYGVEAGTLVGVVVRNRETGEERTLGGQAE